jgi:hypothetical protein
MASGGGDSEGDLSKLSALRRRQPKGERLSLSKYALIFLKVFYLKRLLSNRSAFIMRIKLHMSELYFTSDRNIDELCMFLIFEF